MGRIEMFYSNGGRRKIGICENDASLILVEQKYVPVV